MNISNLIVRIFLLSYLLVLVLISIANLGVFSPNWPFELFASYSRQVLFFSPIFFIICWFFKRNFAPLLMLIAIFTFWPLVSFSKFGKPIHYQCQQHTCLNILSSNLQGRHGALNNLAEIASNQDYDLIGIYDIPDDITEAKLKSIFPTYTDVFMISKAHEGQSLGSKIAIVSSRKLNNNSTSQEFSGRSFIFTEFETLDGEIVRIFAVHPRLPLSYASMYQRDEMLRELKNTVGEDENFIIMGDFNLTPWTPAFGQLPGRRAGDPRFTYTWDSKRPWVGIPIDHIMIGYNFEVVGTEVLPNIGSDHKPIFATLTLKQTTIDEN